jgi:multiple sugar transport system substrate-binding protein
MLNIRSIILIALVSTFSFVAVGATNVTFWHMEGVPHRVDRIQILIDEFNSENPDIVVKQEVQNWGEIYAKAPASVAAGTAPEILVGIPDFTPILAEMGAAQPVEDFIAELDSKYKFYQKALDQYTYNGHTWAVPLWNMAISVWYRKSEFEKAGINPPKNWSELKSAAKKLTKDGVYGIGLPGNKQLYTDQTIYSFMVNSGASEIYNSDGSLRFDNPQTVNAYNAYKELYQYSAPDSASWTWGEAEACFASKSCAMILQFSVIATYDSQAGGDASDLGVIQIPYADGMSDSAGTVSYVNSAMIMTEDKEKMIASKKFLSFLMKPGNYGRFINMEPGLFLPITEAGSKDETFWNDPMAVKYKSQIETMLDNSTRGNLFGFTNGNTFTSISSISAQNLLSQALQLAIINGEDAASAVSEGQNIMQDAIE